MLFFVRFFQVNVEIVKKGKKDISVLLCFFFHLTGKSGKENISIETKQTSN